MKRPVSLQRLASSEVTLRRPLCMVFVHKVMKTLFRMTRASIILYLYIAQIIHVKLHKFSFTFLINVIFQIICIGDFATFDVKIFNDVRKLNQCF